MICAKAYNSAQQTNTFPNFSSRIELGSVRQKVGNKNVHYEKRTPRVSGTSTHAKQNRQNIRKVVCFVIWKTNSSWQSYVLLYEKGVHNANDMFCYMKPDAGQAPVSRYRGLHCLALPNPGLYDSLLLLIIYFIYCTYLYIFLYMCMYSYSLQ